MSNPVLLIKNAGVGTTPNCVSKFKVGDVVRVRRLKHLRHLDDRAAIAIVVPTGFPPEYALADEKGRPRPLIITKPLRSVSYIVAFSDNPSPHHLRESDLLPSNEEPVPIQWQDDQP